MEKWDVIGVVAEGMPIRIGPFENIWNQRWIQTKHPSIKLQHPSYPSQLHAFDIYEIADDDSNTLFAAGELSMNVWGFYQPQLGKT